MSERSSIFDMIGPIMIGPSSSHTAGVVRIGNFAYTLLGKSPSRVTVTFYNSFATTFKGHGSDLAIIAGLLGMKTDDVRIKMAHEIAKKEQVHFEFKTINNANEKHPNTIKLTLISDATTVEVIGVSLGGGVIKIVAIDGFDCNLSAQSDTLIIKADDIKGSIAFIAEVIAHDDCNIATMSVSRKSKNGQGCHFIEMDSGLRPITLQYLQSLKWISTVIYISGKALTN
jgi:L-serine dehydratase